MPDTPTPPPDDPDRLDALLDAARPRGQWDVDAMWARLRDDTVGAEGKAPPATRPTLVRPVAPAARWARQSRRGIFVRALIGTGVGAAIAASLLFLLARDRSATRPPPAAEDSREYSTGRGEVAKIELTDGSRVTLAPRSHLRIPAAFGRTGRTISLEGEAIFEVKHDSLVPFHVRVGTADLTDIGTRFDVQAYDSAKTVTVTVAEGAVSIADSGSSVSPRSPVVVQRGVTAIRRGTVVSLVSSAHPRAVFEWADGALSFENRPLSDVLESIERWYDLDISADESLRQRRVTAELMTKQPSAMLDALGAALDAHVTRDGRRVTLIPNTR